MIVPYQREQVALAELKHHSVTWKSHAPDWLPRWLGAGYLQHVTMLKLERQKLSDEDMRLVARFTRIEKLYLAGNPISDEGVQQLRDLKELRRISLWSTKVTEACLADLATCPQLEAIDLFDKPLTIAGIEHLRALPELKWLRMKAEIDGPVLKALDKLPHSDCLQHGGELTATGVTDETLPILLKQKFLIRLKLIDARLSSEAWMQLQASPQLWALHLKSSRVSPSFFPALAKQQQHPCQSLLTDEDSLTYMTFLTSLEEGRTFESAQLRQHELALHFHNSDYTINGFYIYSGAITREHVEALFRRLQFRNLLCDHPDAGPLLATQTKLTSLVIHRPDAATLQAIGELKQLKRLVLLQARDVLAPTDTEPLRKLVNLREFQCPYAKLTSEHFGFLADLIELEKLAIDGNQTDASVLKSIGQMAELQELNLFDTGVGTNDETIAPLVNCKKLRSLQCTRTALTDRAIPVLKNMANLMYLHVDKSQFSEKELQLLQDTLQARSKIPHP